jgi:hypothetical protein
MAADPAKRQRMATRARSWGNDLTPEYWAACFEKSVLAMLEGS